MILIKKAVRQYVQDDESIIESTNTVEINGKEVYRGEVPISNSDLLTELNIEHETEMTIEDR